MGFGDEAALASAFSSVFWTLGLLSHSPLIGPGRADFTSAGEVHHHGGEGLHGV